MTATKSKKNTRRKISKRVIFVRALAIILAAMMIVMILYYALSFSMIAAPAAGMFSI